MSKLQGREASIFNDIANTTLAGQMESRLKELERNIAVARQFIKLADETYSQVRHEWDLLQQDVGTRQFETHPSPFSTSPEEKHEFTDEKSVHSKERAKSHSSENADSDSAPTSIRPSSHPTSSKKHGTNKNETKPEDEATISSLTSKTLQKSRSRPKK